MQSYWGFFRFDSHAVGDVCQLWPETLEMPPCSAYTDPELHDWLIWAEENGSSFLRAVAEAALFADLKNYALLCPILLELKKEWPKPAGESP